VACSVVAGSKSAKDVEAGLLEELGPLLEGYGLNEKQAASLCKAIAHCAFPVAAPPKEDARPAGKQGDVVLCRVPDFMLMYMGSTRQLLKDTTFELLKGHRYGVVGSNGTGKTTLMESIAGGSVLELAKSKLRFVHIRHETLSERADPSMAAVDFARREAGDTVELEAALREVGFEEELQRKALRELSGGWRVRLLLATAVARRADVLLLDEPTNHLDASAVAWLVDYLARDLRHATSIVVSHDAPFLDKVCTDIVHFDDCKLKYYAGNFTRFQEQALLFDQDEIRALLQVRSSEEAEPAASPFDSGRAKPIGGAKPAARSAPASREGDPSFRMSFPLPGKVDGISGSKKPVLEMKNAWFKYTLAKDYALMKASGRVAMSSRIAIVGPNGAGKSTLLSLLCRAFMAAKHCQSRSPCCCKERLGLKRNKDS